MPAPYPTELKRIFVEEGRKQDWLAKRVGIDPSQVARWAAGMSVPECHRQPIAEALGRKVDDLFFSDGRPLCAAHNTAERAA